ncbi:MAG: DUF4375 domain-containing protein [Byssovorax sp.]
MMNPDDAISFSNDVLKKVGYDRRALSSSLQVVHLIGWLDYEVTLGGVLGWLTNMGEYGPDTVKALETVGAHQCAAIVREILAFFPNGTPASEDRERMQQILAVEDAAEVRWRDLADRLLEWPENIYVLLQNFVSEHEADFI